MERLDVLLSKEVDIGAFDKLRWLNT